MRHLAITVYVFGLQVADTVASSLQRRVKNSERGSVTIEQVAWAVAIIAIVGIAVAAIKAYVTSQAGKLD